MKLYVSNLSKRTINADLKAVFLDYGSVGRASVVFDRETGRSRGFGFVELDSTVAIEDMQAIELDGNVISVELKPDD